eukprot:Plantae.Rhodophyta-Purpureofilum_apyrenoidigerum.ctg7469.p1 GENE.Plantae.Rhodophyta-Purpureofilum_apyrenoidigerum.ctg7469~~Plantae.Rhodophyta-Purpureofilum_apyrenoidigerum.ctg7469.p1  ORF type:complete len:245 (-),score=28.21 Plantae.Rhodophyta-Purpureofilum_apyrenoidigerum.ctg7469:852-1586(-)
MRSVGGSHCLLRRLWLRFVSQRGVRLQYLAAGRLSSMWTTTAYISPITGFSVGRQRVRCHVSSVNRQPRRDFLKLLALGTAGLSLPLEEAIAKPLNPAYPDKNTNYIPKGYPEENGPLPEFEKGFEVGRLDNGFQYQDLDKGTGRTVTVGCLAVAHWRVKLENGNEVINTRIDGKPVFFRVGSGQVEKGVDEGIVGMRVGGKRLLRVKPSEAYSDITTGERSSIPSDGLIFIDIEVYGVDPFRR